MPQQSSAPAPRSTRQAPFQFSMRTLLVVVTIAAIGSAFATFFGPGVGWPIVVLIYRGISIAATICLGTLIIYCRGYRQTFFLGAFVGSLPALKQIGGGSYASWLVIAALLAGNLVCMAGCGWLALATRRFAERRGWHLP